MKKTPFILIVLSILMGCGNIDKKYKSLIERLYKCSKCQNEIDRDINASINIMFEGLKLYMKNEVKI